MYGQSNDQSPRFLKDGIWENGYEDRHLDLVKSMQPGDRIAIKAVHTRKKGLPFDNRGHSVAAMKIKAIGTIAENLGDGNTMKVDWQVLPEPKEWYFYTFQGTIWRVLPGDWRTDALIAFENKPQDYDSTCDRHHEHR